MSRYVVLISMLLGLSGLFAGDNTYWGKVGFYGGNKVTIFIWTKKQSDKPGGSRKMDYVKVDDTSGAIDMTGILKPGDVAYLKLPFKWTDIGTYTLTFTDGTVKEAYTLSITREEITLTPNSTTKIFGKVHPETRISLR